MADAPPSYQQAVGSFGPKPVNGIPAQRRRSMEDEGRPVPQGWIRQFDHSSQHQFYVDTKSDPPRSIWHHPYDDDKYLATLSSEERERIESLNRHPSRADIVSMSSSEDIGAAHGKGHQEYNQDEYTATSGYHAGPSNAPPPKGLKKFGRGLKDKMTGTTHQQREQERLQRDIQEQREYEMHQKLRNAMIRAHETGQPQLLGRDKDGKNVYMEPPGWGRSSYDNGYGYNPYNQGPYGHSNNAVYMRPPGSAYSRPYGYGYGGGYGMPLMGGLLGGALLGGLLF